MDTKAAFLKAIEAAPEDDAAKLAFADWLEEQGDSGRGEFIRLRCELEKLTEWEEDYQQVLERARVVVERHGAEWVIALRAVEGLEEMPENTWISGFPSVITHYDSVGSVLVVCGVMPPIRHIALLGWKPKRFDDAELRALVGPWRRVAGVVVGRPVFHLSVGIHRLASMGRRLLERLAGEELR